MSELGLLLAVVAGVACAVALHLVRFARPWRFGVVAAGEVDATTHAARRVIRDARCDALTIHRAEDLYERWLNLPRDACSAAAEDLRKDGIDMIRLGDTLRRRRRQG